MRLVIARFRQSDRRHEELGEILKRVYEITFKNKMHIPILPLWNLLLPSLGFAFQYRENWTSFHLEIWRRLKNIFRDKSKQKVIVSVLQVVNNVEVDGKCHENVCFDAGRQIEGESYVR